MEGAVDSINDLVNSLLALTDKLSSIVQALTQAIEDAAAAFAKRPSDFTKANAKYIFIGVKGGGCNGLKYFIEPTNDEPVKFDESIKIDENLNINICGKSLMFLIGTEVKWKDDFIGSGVEFVNPNAKGKCGCGETFSI